MIQYLKILLPLLACLLCHLASADEFADAVKALNSESFSDKQAAVASLQTLRDERALPILQALLDGELYVTADTQELVLPVSMVENGVTTISYQLAATAQPLVIADPASLSKVRSNNRLRRELRTAVSGLELSSSSVEKRLSAARSMVTNSSEELGDLVRTAYQSEENPKVKAELSVAVALLDLNVSDQAVRLQAIATLLETFSGSGRAALNNLTAQNDDGSFKEQDEVVRAAAIEALDQYQRKENLFSSLQNLVFGLSAGSVLLLAAVGLAITFGVMGVINMAHGEMIMLGAYTTFALQLLFPEMITLSLFLAIPAAFLVSGSVGVLMERLIIRHLYGRPLDTLLATFGVSLILQQAVRIYNSNNVPVKSPDWMSGPLDINFAFSLTYNRLYIIVFCVFMVVGLLFVMRKTFFGLQMRAVTQNRAMANNMGIRSGWVDAFTFGLGSGVAGIAGVALSQITNVGPNLGQGYIIDSFMVVVFGGVGNLFGTVFAALGLGVTNKFIEPAAGAVLGKIIVLIFVILFIQWRPRGLFPQKGRFVED